MGDDTLLLIIETGASSILPSITPPTEHRQTTHTLTHPTPTPTTSAEQHHAQPLRLPAAAAVLRRRGRRRAGGGRRRCRGAPRACAHGGTDAVGARDTPRAPPREHRPPEARYCVQKVRRSFFGRGAARRRWLTVSCVCVCVWALVARWGRWTESIAQKMKRKKKAEDVHARKEIWRSVFDPPVLPALPPTGIVSPRARRRPEALPPLHPLDLSITHDMSPRR